MSASLHKIYDEEMRGRVEKMRFALALARATDPTARADALYDAHLQAHTMCGTSQQLGFREMGGLARGMCDLLERARDHGELDSGEASSLGTACNAIERWLASGRRNARDLKIVAAAMRQRVVS